MIGLPGGPHTMRRHGRDDCGLERLAEQL